ncbi:MAG: aspartate kinase [Bacteroidia bacterium]
MKVFKFGGASVKDADAVKNIASIIKKYDGEKLVVVISAMGKTTNGLEKVVNAYYYKNDDAIKCLDDVKNYHHDIMKKLFKASHEVHTTVNNLFVEIEWVLEEQPRNYGFVYDQIVSIGELVSTTIISAYLNDNGIKNKWIDARSCIQTDNHYRSGNVDWELTKKLINEIIPGATNGENKIAIVQGFIGGTSENYTTTLGREGSDYTASIFAYCLNAESVTIWKDVAGVLNADPKLFEDAQKLEQISYNDAIELAYFGASVIHPKTIKPIENKNIPLYVKSFIKPDSAGTVIGRDLQTKPLIPSYIFKSNQVLISIAAKDFSFIAEESLSKIFGVFANAGVKINLMQNSAISFSVCIDNDEFTLQSLLDELKKEYRVLYNDDLLLYTIRHYNQFTLDKLTKDREILLEQRTRNTAQIVIREVKE